MKSKYVPPGKRTSAAQNKLFIGNLDKATKKQEILGLFANYSPPLEISIITPFFNQSKTVAFVIFDETVNLSELCQKLEFAKLHGNVLEIAPAKNIDERSKVGPSKQFQAEIFKQGKCLRCSQPGHVSRNCPLPENSCYKCGGNHLGKYCLGAPKYKAEILIPQSEYPDVNFVGILLGPRASTLKKISGKSGAKLAIRGKGSNCITKDPLVDDAELHVQISADNEISMDKCKELINEIIDMAINNQDEIKQKQLWEHAYGKGSARTDTRPINSGKCFKCSKFGHLSKNCTVELEFSEVISLVKSAYPDLDFDALFNGTEGILLLKEIQHDCGCYIEIRKFDAFEDDDFEIRIGASNQISVDKGKEKIMEMIDNAFLIHGLRRTELK